MSDERRFPVLYLHPRARGKVPRDVPWSFVESFRAQAERNHGQTLERLAERGGLDPTEMWLAAHGLPFRAGCEMATAVEWLVAEIERGRS